MKHAKQLILLPFFFFAFMSIAPKADAFVCVYSCTHYSWGTVCVLKEGGPRCPSVLMK